jgi:hypothetical protein
MATIAGVEFGAGTPKISAIADDPVLRIETDCALEMSGAFAGVALAAGEAPVPVGIAVGSTLTSYGAPTGVRLPIDVPKTSCASV